MVVLATRAGAWRAQGGRSGTPTRFKRTELAQPTPRRRRAARGAAQTARRRGVFVVSLTVALAHLLLGTRDAPSASPARTPKRSRPAALRATHTTASPLFFWEGGGGSRGAQRRGTE